MRFELTRGDAASTALHCIALTLILTTEAPLNCPNAASAGGGCRLGVWFLLGLAHVGCLLASAGSG